MGTFSDMDRHDCSSCPHSICSYLGNVIRLMLGRGKRKRVGFAPALCLYKFFLQKMKHNETSECGIIVSWEYIQRHYP